jgi:NADPH:quinone reductase-like Zn-dependent oxidoreductase
MKALVIQDMTLPVAERLALQDVPVPVPAAGEALVRIAAAALNHRDEWIRLGQYAKIRAGVIIGSDGCGVVESVGTEADKHWLQQEVILNPSLAWGTDETAQDPQNFTILGLPQNGTFAEYTIIPVANLAPKPAHLTPAQAAALPLAGLTAYRAVVTQSRVQAGQNVLVTGIGGGVAQFAAQFAAALGANVWVTSGTQEKIERAKQILGARGGAIYKHDGWEKALVAEAGEFDVVIDSAGGAGVNGLLAMLRYGGTYTFFGATAGNPPEVNWRAIFWRQIRLQGTTMGSNAEFAAMVELVSKKKIVPVVDSERSFADILRAFDVMSSGSQFGKLVVTMQM